VKRREFISALGGAAVWPLAGSAEQSGRLRRVGVLLPFPEADPFTQAIMAAFADALRSLGWIEGQNIRVDYRFAGGDPALFKAYAPELVDLSPDAILASTPPAVEALRQQTRKIPIVFVLVQDPVGLGLVQSLARPGGNMTGLGAAEPPIMGCVSACKFDP
jgi:putative ABC transport system substrate-binding protein